VCEAAQAGTRGRVEENGGAQDRGVLVAVDRALMRPPGETPRPIPASERLLTAEGL
jgi:hypothetical protein